MMAIKTDMKHAAATGNMAPVPSKSTSMVCCWFVYLLRRWGLKPLFMCLVVEVFLVSCSLLGCEMRVAAHQKPVFGPILGGFRAPNQFLAQSSAGFGLQISFWPNPRRVLGSKSIFGAIPGGFWASNQFLVQFPAGFGLQTGFWSNLRLISGGCLVV